MNLTLALRLPFVAASALALTLALLPYLGGTPLSAKHTAKVIRVIADDTVIVALAWSEERVRLLRINTPELSDPRPTVRALAVEAKDVLRKLVEGTQVTLDYDVVRRDRHGQLLAHLHLQDGTWVNREMLQLGYAELMTIPPNVRYTPELREAEREASQEGRGLWAVAAE